MPALTFSLSELRAAVDPLITVEGLIDVCFSMGLEIEVEYPDAARIETPSNRLDLFCELGIIRAIKTYRGKPPPRYRLGVPDIDMRIDSSVLSIRPHIAVAILRQVTMTQKEIDSLVAFQTRLHDHFRGSRSVLAIGIHDLDKIQPPLLYCARPSHQISFVPLDQTSTMTAEEIVEFYLNHPQLSKVVQENNMIQVSKKKDSNYQPSHASIELSKQDKTDSSPSSVSCSDHLYVILQDANGTVLSMPPLINGDHTKINISTQNLLIEVTSSSDQTRVRTVLDVISSIFSELSKPAYVTEPVAITAEPTYRSVTKMESTSWVTPSGWSNRQMPCRIDTVREMLGVDLTAEDLARLLERMSLGPCSRISTLRDTLEVYIPPNRPDVMAECDLIEDTAIAYGYNNIRPTEVSPRSVGSVLYDHAWSDTIRLILSQIGFLEVLNFVLCPDPSSIAIANPSGRNRFVRNSLVPPILEALGKNKEVALPVRIFELGQVVQECDDEDIPVKNRAQLAVAIQVGESSGLDQVHGVLDIIWQLFQGKGHNSGLPSYILSSGVPDSTNKVKNDSDPTCSIQYLFGPRAIRIVAGESHIGCMGIIHPSVLRHFNISCVTSVLVLDIGKMTEYQKRNLI